MIAVPLSRLGPVVEVAPTWCDLAMWIDKKRKSVALGQAYAQIGGPVARLAERVLNCAPQIQRYGIERIHDVGLDIKTLFAGTCKARFCPLCATLRARRQYARVVPHFDSILVENPGVRAAFATFTVPNVPFDKGRTAGSAIIGGFRRMTQRKAFKQAVVGWMRAMEVTFDRKTRTLHPHLHVALLLHPHYFSKDHDLYLTQPEWLHLWQRSMGDEAIKIVDVRRLRPRKSGWPLSSALGEVTKYPLKPLEVFKVTPQGYVVDPDVLEPIHFAMRGKRMFGFGGLLRKAAVSVDDGDRIDGEWALDDEEYRALIERAEEPEPYFIEDYIWDRGSYVEGQEPMLSEGLLHAP